MAITFNPLEGQFDIIVKDHLLLDNVGTNTHSQIDDHLADNSQAHSDYLINNGDDTTSGTLTAAGYKVDATIDHTITNSTDDLVITNPNSNGNISFNLNRAGSSGDLVEMNSSEGIFRVNALSGSYGLTGIFNLTGEQYGSGLTGCVGMNPTVVGSPTLLSGFPTFWISNIVQPKLYAPPVLIAFYFNPLTQGLSQQAASVGVMTSGSPIITGIATTSALKAKMYVKDNVNGYIPAGTQIVSVDSSSQVTLSANCTGTATNSLDFGFNVSVETMRTIPPTHIPGFNYSAQILTEQSFLRSAFSFDRHDASTITVTPIIIGGAASVGEFGRTTATIVDTGITITGGASRAFGTSGSVNQKGIKLTGFGSYSGLIAGTDSCYALYADGGLFHFHDNTKLVFGGTSTTPTDDAAIYYNATDLVIDSQIVGTGDVSFPKDSQALKLGAGGDTRIYYDGTVGKIDTSIVAPSDLQIACGTDKTLVLTETVWKDIQFSISSGKVPAANFPDYVAFTTNTRVYSFAVNDYIDLDANEIPHDWKEGTTIKPHLHITLNGANSSGSNQYAKFTLYIAYADVNEVWTETSLTAEQTIPTGTANKTHLLLSLGDLAFTNQLIGTQVKLRIKRIAATGGTEYPTHIFLTQVGIHYEADTLGSRTVSSK